MLNISLHQLEYVVAVARAGSIKAAAERLHISQPSLSVALTKVEDQLGRRLFLRKRGRALATTNFGHGFVIRAAALLQEARHLSDPDTVAEMGVKRLVLGCFVDLAPSFIGRAARALAQAFPQADVSFQLGDFTEIAAALSKGQMDLAITYDIGLDAQFARHELCRIRPSAFVAADHPLAGRRDLQLRDLAALPLILSDEGLSVQHFLNLFGAAGLSPRVQHRTPSLEAMRSLAASGAGVGLSYTAPPGGRAYDGVALHTLPITDPASEEPVLLTQLAAQQGDPWLASALECLMRALGDPLGQSASPYDPG